MFLKIGRDYINTAQIRRIRPFIKENDAGHYVSVEMLDAKRSKVTATKTVLQRSRDTICRHLLDSRLQAGLAILTSINRSESH
ncbi:hypothetical protein LRP30_30860 [Bradyrhizobium sp. C-145]|uniref:hypothetical protein n=1 Tax=Bradyrhizobium sp. C-145 TaxID=574727 RepID=UPI00201B6D5B|nr:hypothetical protein [Bradyrhizobium sp. C-145]UQR61322.1 hypothetical protein LRP30_30860 [Bradyrhizobium sp. C-145]